MTKRGPTWPRRSTRTRSFPSPRYEFPSPIATTPKWSAHSTCSEPVSVFSDLDQRGLLSQRVGDPIEPGSEEEPYVPDVGTRARARARFIREHSDRSDLIMSWDRVIELSSQRVRTLFDPFAEAYAG